MWGCFACGARKTPPHILFTPEIPKEPRNIAEWGDGSLFYQYFGVYRTFSFPKYILVCRNYYLYNPAGHIRFLGGVLFHEFERWK